MNVFALFYRVPTLNRSSTNTPLFDRNSELSPQNWWLFSAYFGVVNKYFLVVASTCTRVCFRISARLLHVPSISLIIEHWISFPANGGYNLCHFATLQRIGSHFYIYLTNYTPHDDTFPTNVAKQTVFFWSKNSQIVGPQWYLHRLGDYVQRKKVHKFALFLWQM